MFLLFGFRTKAHPLGWVSMLCQVCGQSGNLLLVREVTRLSLFFIPLFAVRTRHLAECQNPMCRSATKLTRAESRQLLATGVPAAY